MPPTLVLPEFATGATGTLAQRLATAHDRWMADCDCALGPVCDPDATFLQRWAAIRYATDVFVERFRLERELIQELHPFIVAEIWERLLMQEDRLTRLHLELERLARQRGAARELARTTREFVEALRLWYAEIEFAVGEASQKDIGPEASRLLRRFPAGAPLDDWFVAAGSGWDPEAAID
jgi:hypothetical protein